MREIVALEAQLDPKKPRRQQAKSEEDTILAALGSLESMVKEACGESFMEEEEMSYMDEDMVEMSYMDEDEMSYMDEDEMSYMDEVVEDDVMDYEDEMGYMDYMDGMGIEEDIVLAEGPGTDYPPVPAGAEGEITQDYLDDVLETQENPNSIVTEPSMNDAAPGGEGVTAGLIRASKRLDRVAAYCEQKGSMKLAYKIDQIADAVDARIKKEARNV
jgi:hypothetical protein